MSGGSTSDGGNVLGGSVAVAAGTAGISVLPNTAGTQALYYLSFLTLILGALVLASMAVRVIAKRLYK